jgi:hypothetical protein
MEFTGISWGSFMGSAGSAQFFWKSGETLGMERTPHQLHMGVVS